MAKKSIAIIGEGETEWFYLESLRVAKTLPLSDETDLSEAFGLALYF